MALGTPEIILILAALLLLFGGKKIPEMMTCIGKGMKEFKEVRSSEQTQSAKPINTRL